ncbi:tRNA (adenosine(37)-N6)-threonylcarbamoyltransferase complex dimerization subunit type 1 TsaB [Caenimonas soli]|uniref:tRNA (adenosine(37)-N6)-threonylcarbamoyltransferase complex dimerization subunit type 1 TsaB n=1 Tax=Caenimonas soli TaxID=2735555 RepID=UPI0015523B79|nr:tRNA (adenosine(37)-N6)-threonylcarbamoyltransferase complex dimerization subunit type 1 TsaB [Caenimonas soli]NPC55008.1 tRNA (adenosine(37)-N6)-threonylcarbamoyltransferase complex dimerization subunit type 1 TsaB [Caenimonas soli]
MNLLAFDTSTEILHVAVQCGGEGSHAPLEYTGAGGAQASATLIPAIHTLMAQAGLVLADLDAIVFGRGPGSFTGLRTACSVAQGLSFGSGVPVLAVDTLLAVAEEAYHREGVQQVVALLDARMDEVYSASYARESGGWRRQGEFGLGRPETVAVAPGWSLAGNAFAAYGERLPPAAARIEAMPTARALLRLAPALMAAGQAGPAAGAMPLYIRDKVAQTTEERAASRAAPTTRP